MNRYILTIEKFKKCLVTMGAGNGRQSNYFFFFFFCFGSAIENVISSTFFGIITNFFFVINPERENSFESRPPQKKMTHWMRISLENWSGSVTRKYNISQKHFYIYMRNIVSSVMALNSCIDHNFSPFQKKK